MRLERTIIAVTTRGVTGTCGTRDRCHVEQWGDVFNVGRDSDGGKKSASRALQERCILILPIPGVFAVLT